MLYNYIKSKGNYKIFLNPGTVPNDLNFFNIADNIVVYENNPSFLYSLDDDINLLKTYLSKVSIIVYDVDNINLLNQIISNYPASYYYITTNNLYNNLPYYFNTEIKLLYNYYNK